MEKIYIKKIECINFSSNYGNGKSYGQPKSLKSISIIVIKTKYKDIVGYGETYMGVYAPELVEKSVIFLNDFFIGLNILDEKLFLNKVNLPFISNSGFIKSITGALEIAQIDLISKFKQIPCFNIINPNQKKSRMVNIYASGGSVIYTKKQIQEEVEIILDRGFKAYKMRIGLQSFNIDIEKVKIAKDLLKENFLMVDAIMGTLENKWDIKKATKYIQELKKSNILWLEEPLKPDLFYEYSKLNSISKINIAFGESFTSYSEFILAHELNCSLFLQPDVTNCGINTLRSIFSSKKFKNHKFAMHVWGSPLAFLSNLHASIAFKKISWIEFPLVKMEFLKELYDELIFIENGKVNLNHSIYGFGLNLNKSHKKIFNFKKGSGYRIL